MVGARRVLSGVGAVGLGLGAVAVPGLAASATSPADVCDTPTDGTITFDEATGVCQVEFAVGVDSLFTVPAGATQLSALLVSGGEGASGFSDGWGVGLYAGDGGSVLVADLSADADAWAGQDLSVYTGAAGVSDMDSNVWASGEESILTDPDGNDWTSGYTPYGSLDCTVTGLTVNSFSSAGAGAAGDSSQGSECDVASGPGLVLSESDVDSFDNPVLPIWSDVETLFGQGGRIVRPGTTVEAGIGDGGSVLASLDGQTIEFTQPSDGAAYIRWIPAAAETPAATLATTGAASATGVALASTVFGAGLIALVASRLRRQSR